MPQLHIDGVSKRFGDFCALDDIQLEIPAGSLLCLLGPSGCGKTTLLRIIAGLESADSGRIWLDGDEVSSLPPHRRDLGMVFQSHALFPHLSVAENIGYGLRIAGASKSEQQQRVQTLLEITCLPDSGDKRITQLSGGQRQRVAIARALARNPKIFLLDEPTSSLDANLRETMQIELRRLQQTLNITTIVVTHDQSEAMTLADSIVVMRDGAIEQVGTPSEIYEHPRTAFVANFIGATNMLRGAWDDHGIHHGVRLSDVVLSATVVNDVSLAVGELVDLCIRPERVKVIIADNAATFEHDNSLPDNLLLGKIDFVRNIGNLSELHIACECATIVHTYSPQDVAATTDWRAGDAVGVHLPAEYCRVYPI